MTSVGGVNSDSVRHTELPHRPRRPAWSGAILRERNAERAEFQAAFRSLRPSWDDSEFHPRRIEEPWDNRDLNATGVRYLMGGYAVMVHTEPRYTKDLDLWIEPVEPNARKLFVCAS